MKGPAPLPTRLSSVEVPRFLSPSRFRDLLGCKLSVLAEPGGSRPVAPSPQAVFGLILHHLRREWVEGRYRPEPSVSEAVSKSLKTMARQADTQLQLREETARLVPLREALGWWAWAKVLSDSNSGSCARFLVGSATGHDRCRRSLTHLQGARTHREGSADRPGSLDRVPAVETARSR